MELYTLSNRYFDLSKEITENDICFKEIAKVLAKLNRFNGHTAINYSVLQHSLLVCDIAKHFKSNSDTQKVALIHDAHEAYLQDISSPLKKAFVNKEYHLVSEKLDNAMFKKANINLNNVNFNAIKTFDTLALHIEAYLVLNPVYEWGNWRCDTKDEIKHLIDILWPKSIKTLLYSSNEYLEKIFLTKLES